MGTNLDVAAADQSRPSATRAAKLIHPMRSIFIPHLGKIGLAYFLPSECEVAHTSRGITAGPAVIKLRPARAAPAEAVGGLFQPDPAIGRHRRADCRAIDQGRLIVWPRPAWSKRSLNCSIRILKPISLVQWPGATRLILSLS